MAYEGGGGGIIDVCAKIIWQLIRIQFENYYPYINVPMIFKAYILGSNQFCSTAFVLMIASTFT